jgi:hypothetical protein
VAYIGPCGNQGFPGCPRLHSAEIPHCNLKLVAAAEKLKRKVNVDSKKSQKMLKKCAKDLLCFPCRCLIAKMLEWREREHEEDDLMALNDPGTMNSLRQCGLLKFFKVQGMRAQRDY